MIKAFFNNKQNVIILCITVGLVVLILIAALVFGNNQNNIDKNGTTATTESTTESTTTENQTESTTEFTTESTTEKETTTKKDATSKKPNKTETTTKKPTLKSETTTHRDNTKDELRELRYNEFGGKEGYEAHLKEVAKYKCSICGDHNCPSLDYGADVLGNPDFPSLSPEKCPAIINGTAKCPHCGKTLVEDDRWLTEPDKYCDGTCHLSFG